MSEGLDPEPHPEPAARQFETAYFQLGILLLLVVGLLVYVGTLLLPMLFRSTSPSTDAPVAGDVAPAGPPPQHSCRHGFGVCDWAGLHSLRPSCHNGVGTCDWAGLQSPQPRCPDGGAGCDSAALQPTQPRCRYGVGACSWGRRRSK